MRRLINLICAFERKYFWYPFILYVIFWHDLDYKLVISSVVLNNTYDADSEPVERTCRCWNSSTSNETKASAVVKAGIS